MDRDAFRVTPQPASAPTPQVPPQTAANTAADAARYKLGDALAWLERTRGQLLAFEAVVAQLDVELAAAAALLRAAGHEGAAWQIERHLLGRHVRDGRWVARIVEELDETCRQLMRAVERRVGADRACSDR
jgi:hypothetical protein